MTLVKDDKPSDDPKSKQDRRKEKKATTTTSDPGESVKQSVENVEEEDEDLSGPSSGVREGVNKKNINQLLTQGQCLPVSQSYVLMRIAASFFDKHFFIETFH